MPPRPLLGRERHGHPVVTVFSIAEKEILGHHPDHFGRHAIHQHGPPNDGLVTAEAPAPQVVTQHHDRGLRLVLFYGKRTSPHRLHTKDIKEVWRHLLTGKLFRLPISGQTGSDKTRGQHVREHSVSGLPVQVVSRRRGIEGEADKGCVLPDDHQPVRPGVR